MTSNTFYKITNSEDKWYKVFRDIYNMSFPIFEQRSDKQQQTAFNSPNYHLQALVEDETLLSFISYWDFEDYIYIEHLAVNSAYRGQNIGSSTLNLFAREKEKCILLEIDPPIDLISKDRLRFYSHLGYKPNMYKHLHPAYNLAYPPHELVVLSLYKTLSEEQYKQFCSDLVNIVMAD